MKVKSMLIVLAVSLIFINHLSAETVILKSGQKVEGKITERTDKYVKINFQGVELIYYQDEIASIVESGKKVSVSGQDLSFKPAYAPIDFSALAQHYPTESELGSSGNGDLSGIDLGENDSIMPVSLSTEGLSEEVKKALPSNIDPSSAIASLPPEYQQMVKTIQNNPQDISTALSQLPAEYRSMVEGAMQNIPQAQASGADVKKE